MESNRSLFLRSRTVKSSKKVPPMKKCRVDKDTGSKEKCKGHKRSDLKRHCVSKFYSSKRRAREEDVVGKTPLSGVILSMKIIEKEVNVGDVANQTSAAVEMDVWKNYKVTLRDGSRG